MAAAAQTLTHQDFPAYKPQMKGPLGASVLFHVFVVFIAIVGLPYIKPELPDIDTSITVELMDASEMTDMQKKPKDKPVKKQPEQKKEEPPKRVMPKVTSITPPKPTAPAPPVLEEFAPPEEKEPEQIKKPEPVKPQKAPPKPLKRPVLTKPEPEPQQEEFKSLLRNLMPAEEEPLQGENIGTTTPQAASQQMNQGELAALKRQLDGCWSVLAGARYAEDLIIELKLFVNPDRTIRDVRIVNQMRYNTDKFFRAAADSAQRAVFRCNPLDLPPNKYDLWQTITVTFDPGKML